MIKREGTSVHLSKIWNDKDAADKTKQCRSSIHLDTCSTNVSHENE